jgi:hypothetical protein
MRGVDMTYWFMRMRQGSKGPDFTEELWQQRLVGVLWGTWTIEDVASDNYPTRLDERKLTSQNLNVSAKQLQAPRRFLFAMSPNDRVVVAYGKCLHLGVLGEGYAPDPAPSRRRDGEQFKCRPIRDDSNSFHDIAGDQLPAHSHLQGLGEGHMHILYSPGGDSRIQLLTVEGLNL